MSVVTRFFIFSILRWGGVWEESLRRRLGRPCLPFLAFRYGPRNSYRRCSSRSPVNDPDRGSRRPIPNSIPSAPTGLAVLCAAPAPETSRTHALGWSHRTYDRWGEFPAATSLIGKCLPPSRAACTLTLPRERPTPCSSSTPTCRRSAPPRGSYLR